VGGGVDPLLSIADNIPVFAGTTVTIPVSILTDADTYVDGATYTVVYETNVLDFVSASRGADFTIANGWSLLVNEDPNGTLNVAMGSASGHSTDATPDLLEILTLTFNVLANAPAGTSDLDIEPVDPNEGGLTWSGDDGSVDVTNLPGDYNRNGRVDVADYIIWRKTLNTSVPNYSGADGDGDGQVDEDDYDVWRDNYGTPGSGSGSSASSVASNEAVPASPAESAAAESAPAEPADSTLLSAEPAPVAVYEPAASVEYVSATAAEIPIVSNTAANDLETATQQDARDEALAGLAASSSSPTTWTRQLRSAAIHPRIVEARFARSDALLIDLAIAAKRDRDDERQESIFDDRNNDDADAFDELFADLETEELAILTR
jgi:hypothetical protein